MNEKVFYFAYVFVVIFAFCAGYFLSSLLGSGRVGSNTGASAELYKQSTDDLKRLAEQNRVIRERCENLEGHLIIAGRIIEQLRTENEVAGTDTARAITLSKKIRAGIVNLESWWNNVCREYPGLTDLGPK